MKLRTILVSTTLVMGSCTWSDSDLAATQKHFADHKADYTAALAMVRAGKTAEDLKAAFPDITAEGVAVKPGGTTVEFTPIDFYYVIVFASSQSALDASEAMQDEGSEKAALGGGWHLVQRGFM